MKRGALLALILICPLASATKYYAAPNGIDGPYPTRGTIDKPWRTWHYAFNHTTPGDTCYFRGGVYSAYSTSIGAKINTSAVDGTHNYPTCFFAYPDDWVVGNYPVLDCYNKTSTNSYNIGVEISKASHLYFKGLTVTNARQTTPEVYAAGMGWYLWAEGSTTQYAPNDIRFENCSAHHNGGAGFKQQTADSVYFINCDAWNNCDSISSYEPGGLGTGFGIGHPKNSYSSGDPYTYLYGCRAWNNSDQGFSFHHIGTIVAEYCWSLNNGNVPFKANNQNKGSGFKLWYNNDNYKDITKLQLIIKNSIIAYNAHCGINWTADTDMPEIRAHIYNNFIYRNIYDPGSFGDAWGYGVRDGSNADTVGSWDHWWKNNVSYYNLEGGEVGHRDEIRGIRFHSSDNLFDLIGTPVTSSYFLSLDTTGMMGLHTRKDNGSRPETDFGKPAPGSPLIDAGTDVGQGYNGNAPDIGWFESSYGSPSIPLLISATIENATPSRLDITYNLTLANIVPVASSFTVTVNGSDRTVSSVSVSGTKVLLTMASPVLYGDIITVAYTKPASNPLQAAAGGQAASFTAKTVTNNVVAVLPVFISSVVENSTPSRIDITYNLTLANIVPAASSFAVTVNGSARSVSSVSISGIKVLLTMASPVLYGDIVTVAYTKPASNPLQTASGGQAASFTARSVTNNVAAVIPVYVSSVIENATPSRIDITYNLILANIVPDASSFTVTVNGSAKTVSSVSVSGTKVLLTLAVPVVNGNTVTIAYTKPASNPLQAPSGGQASSFTSKSVTNNVTMIVNQPPSVNILSPTKSTSFVAPASITIEAVAFDPDGSITKVEFYQASVKLGEVTSAPYSFVWKDVQEGTYSITVAATDKQNMRTVSQAITIVVEKSPTRTNQKPLVNITIVQGKKKPKKNDDIMFVADATDPDGSVIKVEFFNGDIKLSEVTQVPFNYTLRNVDTGYYHITALATDNLGATTISQTINFRIDDILYDSPDFLNIYPNPNNGQFKVDFLTEFKGNDRRISILNSMGIVIFSENIAGEENSLEIYLEGSTPEGIYILMVNNGKTVFSTRKFIISK